MEQRLGYWPRSFPTSDSGGSDGSRRGGLRRQHTRPCPQFHCSSVRSGIWCRLSEDRVERTDLDAVAWAVAITRNRVFVAGSTIIQTNARDLLVRAYDITSGALVWETTRPSTSPTAIKASGGRMLFAGSSSNGSYVGVLDAKSGALLWEDQSTTDSSIVGTCL